MRKQSNWIFSAVLIAAVTLVLGVHHGHGSIQERGAQGRGGGGAAAQAPLVNIKVMKGLTRQEVGLEMQKIRAQLGVQCVYCHVQNNGQNDFASDDKPEKLVARQMIQMVQLLNDQEFFKSGTRKVECFTCHRGEAKVPVAPPLPPPVQGGGAGARGEGRGAFPGQ